MSKNDEKTDEKPKRGIERSLHPRYEWIDQYRGTVFLFYIISSCVWIFAVLNTVLEPSSVGPIYLNWGDLFTPGIITIVDLGLTIYAFILGISCIISFKTNLDKKGADYAWLRVFQRVFAFFFLSSFIGGTFHTFTVLTWVLLGLFVAFTIAAIIFRNLKKYRDTIYRPLTGLLWAIVSTAIFIIVQHIDTPWIPIIGSGVLSHVFFGVPGTSVFDIIMHGFTYFAWGTLIAALFVYLIKKADFRIIIPIVILIGFPVMWHFEGVINSTIQTFWPQWQIPYELLSVVAIAIIGTCVWDWMNLNPENRNIGIKKRVVPLLLISAGFHFILDFFQPASTMNGSVVFLGIAFSGMLLVLFHSLESMQFKIPVLSSLGRNTLVMMMLLPFFFTYFINNNDIYLVGIRGFLRNILGVSSTYHPLVSLVSLALFVVPIVLLSFIAWVLDKLKLHFRI